MTTTFEHIPAILVTCEDCCFSETGDDLQFQAAGWFISNLLTVCPECADRRDAEDAVDLTAEEEYRERFFDDPFWYDTDCNCDDCIYY